MQKQTKKPTGEKAPNSVVVTVEKVSPEASKIAKRRIQITKTMYREDF